MSPSKFAAAMMVGSALATSLTTIQPCTQASGLYPDVTVTEQFQPVSFCVPTSTLKDGKYATSYPLASTSVYVSTVIPCGWDGKSASTCTVTTTNQDVLCKQTATTITSVTPITTAAPHYNGTHSNATSYSTWYRTISKKYNAPFNGLGGLAIPGFGGSGLCKNCEPQSDGSRVQNFNVTECAAKNNEAPKCSVYTESWVSKKVAPTSTSVAQASVATKSSVASAGTYTFTFAQNAPAATFAVPAKGGNPASTITGAPQPWFAYVTKSCDGPTTFDFTTTVTKTITFYVPYETKTPTGSTPISTPAPAGWGSGWGSWPTSTSTSNSATTTPASSDPSKGDQHAGWGNWASATTTTSSSASTTSAGTTSSGITTSGTTSAGTTTSYVTSSTSTTSGGVYPTPEFKIQVIDTSKARFRKRSLRYIGFAGDDANVVEGDSAAAFFKFEGQDLKTGSDFISTEGSSAYVAFERTSVKQTSNHYFHLGADKTITLDGASGFCTVGDALIIVYSSAPENCVPCKLQKDDGSPVSTTTTTTASYTSTTTLSTITTTSAITTTTTSSWYPTTTTTSADPSADLEIADPTHGPGSKHIARHRRAAIRRFK